MRAGLANRVSQNKEFPLLRLFMLERYEEGEMQARAVVQLYSSENLLLGGEAAYCHYRRAARGPRRGTLSRERALETSPSDKRRTSRLRL
jgi:hypothetical protein